MNVPATVRWSSLALVAALLAGWPMALFAGCLAGWHLLRDPAPETVLRVAALLMGLVPAVWFLVNRHRFGEVTFELASANRAPSYLAAAGLLTLVVGVVREVLAPKGGIDETEGMKDTSP